ncbi:RNA polymerase sigma factor [Patescibacteria group bacterium]|nr:RNA polymerase sigma factor [Patescibacteria group bacterium]
MTEPFSPALSLEEAKQFSDEAILEQARAHPKFFEILVERYQQPFFRASYRILKQKEDAEDATQEAFVKMYRFAEKFQKQEGIAFKSWAYKILVNTSLNFYRKKYHTLEFLEAPEDMPEVKEERNAIIDGIEQKEKRQFISSVLEKMPLQFQTILAQYYLDDKSYKTIAASEQLPLSTLKTRLFRAKKLFKKLANEEKEI